MRPLYIEREKERQTERQRDRDRERDESRLWSLDGPGGGCFLVGKVPLLIQGYLAYEKQPPPRTLQ